MTLAISLRSELLKSKRSSSFYICLLAAAVVPMIYFFDALMDADELDRIQKDPWNLYIKPCIQGMSLLILPMFVVLTHTLLPQMEYRNNTWKQALSSPQPLWQLYFSKFLLLQLFTIFCLISFDVILLITVYIVSITRPELGFADHSIDWTSFWSLNARAYIALLGMSAVQYWMGIRFRNFILPIAIGFTLWFMGGIVGLELHSAHIEWYPHAYPILVVFPKFDHLLNSLLLRSAAFGSLFLVLGWLDFERKK